MKSRLFPLGDYNNKLFSAKNGSFTGISGLQNQIQHIEQG